MGQVYPPQPLFRYQGNFSLRIYCSVCLRAGFPGGSWMDPCIEHPEHPHLCLCGRKYPSRAAVAAHVRAARRYGWEGHEKI
jgi:hypothetical protein